MKQLLMRYGFRIEPFSVFLPRLFASPCGRLEAQNRAATSKQHESNQARAESKISGAVGHITEQNGRDQTADLTCTADESNAARGLGLGQKAGRNGPEQGDRGEITDRQH